MLCLDHEDAVANKACVDPQIQAVSSLLYCMANIKDVCRSIIGQRQEVEARDSLKNVVRNVRQPKLYTVKMKEKASYNHCFFQNGILSFCIGKAWHSNGF